MRTVVRTLEEAEQAIRDHREFRLKSPSGSAPSLWGTTEPPVYYGRIPARHSVGAEGADYWVFSYTTLIAWSTDGEPTIPDVGYSPTTGQHQYLVASAWGLDFQPARGRNTVEIPRNDSLDGRPRRLRRGGIDGFQPGSGLPEYAWQGEDAMHYSAQDELMDEIWGGTFPAHP